MIPQSLNILIVEDALIIIKQLYHLLSDKQTTLNIQIAESAELGLQKMNEQFPDVLILDIKLPGISGLELLNKVKTEYPSSSPLIIFLTNMPHSTYRYECLNKGAHFFLDKSRDFLLLPEIIDKFIINRDFNKVISYPLISNLCNTNS
ncbi:MAG: hypothetical protein CUR34_06560 [Sediminibacterium sp.]|nr:MAG: hypothetical protein CUR34_06560 [Sediminibacterium sp.] [Sediminibacterium sp. FEMGT703S]